LNRFISTRLNGDSLAIPGSLLAERSLLLAKEEVLLALRLIFILLYIMSMEGFSSKTPPYQGFLKRKAMVI
jgi:hypothetical protein